MSEFKTLKDMEKENEYSRDGDYFQALVDIRKEAVEWIKEDLEFLKCCTFSLEVEVIIKIWMERFNIIEEDLQ